jgi:hypothetical protein
VFAANSCFSLVVQSLSQLGLFQEGGMAMLPAYAVFGGYLLLLSLGLLLWDTTLVKKLGTSVF